jgi:hypothetical protein
MRIRTVSLALVVLLGSLLTGCLTDRRVDVAAGEYAPVHGAGSSGLASAIQAVRVDRDNHTAWFMLTDGSQVIVSLTPLPRAEWPPGCPTNVGSTYMELLHIEEQALTIASTTFHRPVLVRNCPPDPVEIVLRSGGEIGGSGDACTGAGECIPLETASGPTSLPRSMKGYELYNWYVEEDDAWYYTLVTGTNRVKSYAEISTPESVITEDDWVKITVTGIDPLKSVLDLLPQRQIITWLDTRRLEAAPPVEEVFPGQVVVREIERYCQRRNIRLDVVDWPVGSGFRSHRWTGL